MLTADQVLVFMFLNRSASHDAGGIARSFQDAGHFVSTDDVRGLLDHLVGLGCVIQSPVHSMGINPYCVTFEGEGRASALLALTVQ